MLFGVGVSSRILYSIVGYFICKPHRINYRLGKRELIFLLSFTCNHVVSVRDFLFLLVLGNECF